LGPLFATFLAASSAPGGGGMVTRLLQHEALVALGEFSFEAPNLRSASAGIQIIQTCDPYT